jgi:hypothetical protein
MLLELVFAIFFKKTTRKTSRNSSKSSSQTGKDNTSIGKNGSHGKGKTEDSISANNSRTVVTDIILSVEACSKCGESLKDKKVYSHERRTRVDVVFEKNSGAF